MLISKPRLVSIYLIGNHNKTSLTFEALSFKALVKFSSKETTSMFFFRKKNNYNVLEYSLNATF